MIPEWMLQEIVKALFISLPTGFVSFVLGMWYFNKYQLPKLYANMGKKTIEEVAEHPKIKKFIERGQNILEQLEPLIEKLKKIDFDQIQKDLKPLMKSLKKIDPKTIDELLKSAKVLINSAAKPPKKVPKPKPT